MKKLLFTIVFTMIMSAVSGVAVFAQSSMLTTQKWGLTHIGSEEMSGSTAHLNIESDRKRFSGSAGCNRMFGGLSVSRNVIRFLGAGTTRMACSEALMQNETKFLEALAKVNRFRIAEGVLYLNAGRENVLRFEALSDSAETIKPSVNLEDNRWVLESIKGKPVGEMRTPATLNFKVEDSSIGGNSGCNAYGGSFETKGSQLTITQPFATLRACVEDNIMEVERGLFDGLSGADRYEISNGKLTLFKGTEALLVFAAQ